MKKIGIFFGSTTGNTEEVAGKIAKNMGVDSADVHDVAKTAPSAVGDYDVLIFGSSTWGDGQMQDSMHDFLDGVAVLALNGKQAAVFGCGDESMSDTFCDSVGEMYARLKPTGVSFIGGDFPTDGYTFSHTDADVDGHIVGLLVDNMNHSDSADARISAWATQLKSQI